MRIVGPIIQTWACRGTIGGAGRAGRASASTGEASVADFFQLYFGFKALLLSTPILFDLFLSSGAFSFGDKLKYSLRSILFESSHFLMQSPVPSSHGALNNVPTTLLVPGYLPITNKSVIEGDCFNQWFMNPMGLSPLILRKALGTAKSGSSLDSKIPHSWTLLGFPWPASLCTELFMVSSSTMLLFCL